MIAYPASVQGLLTRVLEAGSGPHAVLFVHGVGSRADRWRFNLEAVAAGGYRCLALDLPGHGFASKTPEFAYGAGGYAAFLEDFLEGRGLSRVHLVGSSLGAQIVSTLACRRPDLAGSLALAGATGMFPIGREARSAIAARLVDLSREGIERKLRTVIHDQERVTSALIDEEYAINTSPGASLAFSRLADYFLHHIDEDAIGEQLAKLAPSLPVLLIWGREDRSVPLSIGLKTRQLLGGVALEIMSGAAHAPYWENPKVFNEILLGFLDSAKSA